MCRPYSTSAVAVYRWMIPSRALWMIAIMDPAQVFGRIVVIVGPSSVGKTTLATRLQRDLPGLWLVAGADLFWGMLDEGQLSPPDFRADSPQMRLVTRGWHRAVASLARAGNDLIADEVLLYRWWLDDWREALRELPWWVVRLQASLSSLQARERERGDREPGLALRDLEQAEDPGEVALDLPTDRLSVAECAARVTALVARSDRP